MKLFSLSAALAVASFVSAQTVYVTQTHVTTINGEQATTEVGYKTDSAQQTQAAAPNAAPVKAQQAKAAADDHTPTTLVTKSATDSGSSSTSSSDDDDDSIYADISKSPDLDSKFAKSILDAHNKKRALHHADKLSWNKDVYNYAQAYADKYDCSGQLVHSGGKYGENLAVGYSDGVSALDAWYSEEKGYNYDSNTYNHFTQVVWKDTTQVGCAIKDCSSNNWGHYVICSYNPPGNWAGKFKENVLPE